MSILILALILALAGFLVWVILQIPMPMVFKNVILAVVGVCLIIFVLQQFGVNVPGMPVMRLFK